MLNILGLRPRGLSDQLKLKLPQLNSFVALAMTGSGPRGRARACGSASRNAAGATPDFRMGNASARDGRWSPGYGA